MTNSVKIGSDAPISVFKVERRVEGWSWQATLPVRRQIDYQRLVVSWAIGHQFGIGIFPTFPLSAIALRP